MRDPVGPMMRTKRKARGLRLADVSARLLAKYPSTDGKPSGWSLKSLQRREVDETGRLTTIEDFERWCEELGLSPMVAAVEPKAPADDESVIRVDLSALTESQRAAIRRAILAVPGFDRNQCDGLITMLGVIEGHHKIL